MNHAELEQVLDATEQAWDIIRQTHRSDHVAKALAVLVANWVVCHKPPPGQFEQQELAKELLEDHINRVWDVLEDITDPECDA